MIGKKKSNAKLTPLTRYINNLFYKLGGAAAPEGGAANEANYGVAAQPQRRAA